MAEKIFTIPFGAEIPKELAEAFDEVVSEEGWIKKRTLAAAIRAFVAMAREERNECYKSAYDSIEEAEPDIGKAIEEERRRVRANRLPAKGHG